MEYLCNKVIALKMCVIIAYQLNNSLLKLLVMDVNFIWLPHVWEYADVQWFTVNFKDEHFIFRQLRVH